MFPARTQPAAYDESHRLISYNSVRGLIGWIGIGLPVILIGIGALVTSMDGGAYRWAGSGIVETSLSDYHGSPMRNVFVGMLTAIGVFLLAYKGHDTRDDWMASLAGAMAILVAIFPDDCDAPAAGICTMDSFAGPLADRIIESGTIHFSAAFVLFALMGLMCLAQFTQTGGNTRGWPARADVTTGKWRRNIAFITCGFVIHGSILYLIVHKVADLPGDYALLIAETIMVVAFGFAWQLKGEVGRNVKNKAVVWLLRPYQTWFWKGDETGHAGRVAPAHR